MLNFTNRTGCGVFIEVWPNAAVCATVRVVGSPVPGCIAVLVRDMAPAHPWCQQKELLTNAKKVTVSVLYWYKSFLAHTRIFEQELSQRQLWEKLFFLCRFFPRQ
jgi:hypothetical protein